MTTTARCCVLLVVVMIIVHACCGCYHCYHHLTNPEFMQDGTPESWAQMAMEMQQGHYSEPKYLRDTEADLVKPFEEEDAARQAVLDSIDDDDNTSGQQ